MSFCEWCSGKVESPPLKIKIEKRIYHVCYNCVDELKKLMREREEMKNA
jgi:ribosome-binding protein aMBF1 (putative translation factor)